MININNTELSRIEKLEDQAILEQGGNLEAFGILFKDCQKVGSSMLLSISYLVQAIEGEGKKTMKEYLDSEKEKIVFSNENKNIFFLGIATFLLQYSNKEARETEKGIFEKMASNEGNKYENESPKYEGEFEYKGKYYLVISPQRPMGSIYETFLDLISNPKQFDKMNDTKRLFAGKIDDIL